ncbi:hypothetical protein SAMN05421788_103334 [Filimonas lacunae]|uniref:MoxR-vWA-beta-propeller ternary system domain-containing protein n=1 Tax=Filimonas lacunae TaxID=477680 RepID=A0A173MKR1_9BACT|nr:hypothetical protein [Filimonas lacunae]BAV07991.1 hypothetical protein FLA_4024 [Filimonas lacunae]SIT07583.1 hypothetical protein SAMN05421788_103334 [Filimonas lacunae]
MAEDAANPITWLLHLALPHRHYLGRIRHWDNLSIAEEGEHCWVKDFTPQQLDSTAVKSIPFITIYYCKQQQLFPAGKLVPVQSMPAGLHWQPIAKGLGVTLPGFNHNYFGIQQSIPVTLVPSQLERQAYAMLVKLEVLQAYIETAPAVRLQPLQWIILDNHTACVIGVPLLPVQGEVLWKDERFLLPVGYDFEWRILSEVISSNMKDHYNWVLWQKEGSWLPIAPQQLQPLTISSFRLSMQRITTQKRSEG